MTKKVGNPQKSNQRCPVSTSIVSDALVTYFDGHNRARVSKLDLAKLYGVSKLRQSTISLLKATLDADHGIALHELDRGGFALFRISTLEGAPVLDLGKLR